ncbi:MAG TPA: HlyD family efflux transporter periplasmic adaptor subunit [Steroidobacteraceae bacterium]|nr:HlyD family efflux transporter periplasmic adaptor subunit [Steroidobacteraceae bacterium]
MDRVIEKKPRSPLRWILIAAGAAIVIVVTWQIFARTGSARLRVDSTRLTTSTVEKADFREYYPFDGTVEPAETVFLDIEEGGRVDQIFAESGQQVRKGDLLLRFSNAQAQRTSIETETRLLETLDAQRNTEFNRAQSNILLQEQLLQIEHDLLDVEAKFNRYDTLMKTANSPVSREAYETTRDQLKYLKSRRDLMKERIRQEDILSANQVEQAKKSITRLNENLELLNRIVKALEVRAPLSGQLSAFNPQLGQNFNRGQALGQIDVPGSFKIRARIDQFYLSRVQAGTPGQVNLDGKNWNVKVLKTFPDVKNNLFEADVLFDGEAPANLRRGQTVTVELSFGSPSESLIVAKGGFYQQTGGRWVYLLSEDGKTAHRAEVKLGRQNPRQVEVLEGLKEGDRIVTSGYDSYNNADELRFSEAIEKQ